MSFDGRLLAGVSALTAVVESGSFVRAADALGITASGVSRAVARLEARVGARLLDRTTRAVSLNEEGRRFYERVKPSLTAIEEAAIDASGAASVVRGRLRARVAILVATRVLAGHLGGFLARYPDLSLDILTQDRTGDLVGDGIDVAISFGDQATSSLIARKLAHIRVLTVASPAYLKRHGKPAGPDDLKRHVGIHFRDPATGQAFAWGVSQGAEGADGRCAQPACAERRQCTHHRSGGGYRHRAGHRELGARSDQTQRADRPVSRVERRAISALCVLSIKAPVREDTRLHRFRARASRLKLPVSRPCLLGMEPGLQSLFQKRDHRANKPRQHIPARPYASSAGNSAGQIGASP